MKTRSGQAALYLVMVLFAIAVLMLVNVNAFLAVRAKNRMMNAVDQAAIAVAKSQGALLNRIGELNVLRLRAAVLGQEEPVELEAEQRRLAFLGPVRALARANAVAADWGCASGDSPDAADGFRDHLDEIKSDFELYPEDRDNFWGEDLWRTYAAELSSALDGNPAVLPGYMEMVNPGASGLFANHAFYDVIAAKAWCWFTVGNNRQYLEQDPAQLEPAEIRPAAVPENSEVFSLHVTYKGWLDTAWASEYVSGEGFNARWTNFVCQVTGLSEGDFAGNSTAADWSRKWAFYDCIEADPHRYDNPDKYPWKKWSERKTLEGPEPFTPDTFPIAGTVRPEYDITGCFASCMMLGHIPQLQWKDGNASDRTMLVTAEAKPLGTVEDHLNGGGAAPVTAYCGFIAPSRPGERIFTEAQLVLMGSVPRSPGVSMEPAWYDHLKHHSPQDPALSGCGYCFLWRQWASLRDSAREWLRQNEDSCRAKGGDGPAMKGGYEYAH